VNVPQALLAFAVAAGLLTITPGLDTALVLRTAAVEGPKRAMLAGLGICCGCLVWAAAASVGLGALLAASQLAYRILQVSGAIYLLYLGLTLLFRRGLTPLETSRDSAASTTQRPDNWYWRGLLTNLLNPKVGVFYVTFLPQFIPTGINVISFSLLLAFIHATQGLLWFSLLTTATRPLSRWLKRPGTARTLDRITGAVLVAFGIDLLLRRRPAV
jgi:threonine/homoserine/homoserine lactone efflux protein